MASKTIFQFLVVITLAIVCIISYRVSYGQDFWFITDFEYISTEDSVTSTIEPVRNNSIIDKMLQDLKFSEFLKTLNGSSLSQHTKAGPIKLLTAYAYTDHFMVLLADFKNTRYLDDDENEVIPPIASMIQPVLAVYCSRVISATRISVTRGRDENITDVKELIERFEEPSHNLAFCFSPIFGLEPKWMFLVELFEHYKLQGVTHFFVYTYSVSDYDMKIINSYVADGIAEVINMGPNIKDDIARQLVAVEDCLYRSKNFANWSIFSDIDERIMLTDENRTLSEFVSSVEDEFIASIAFPQRWIMKRDRLPEQFLDSQQVEHMLPTRRWHRTSGPGVPGTKGCKGQKNCWGKTIIRSEKIIEMGVHEARLFYPQYVEKFVRDDVGFIRHYRDVSMQDWEQKNKKQLESLGPMVDTYYPEPLASQLLVNILWRLKRVYT